MARTGQRLMQAMQCVQWPCHTGRPPLIAMSFTGQTSAHLPQEMQLSPALKGPSRTMYRQKSRLTGPLFSRSTAPGRVSGKG